MKVSHELVVNERGYIKLDGKLVGRIAGFPAQDVIAAAEEMLAWLATTNVTTMHPTVVKLRGAIGKAKSQQ